MAGELTLSELSPAPGARHRRKIVGRGEGSGHGQTATRGMKGQGSRAGDGRMMGFEGGQNPLIRRMPKHGFNNAEFRHVYSIVNLESLERCFDSGTEVTPDRLRFRGLIRGRGVRVKILGEGRLTKKLTVRAHAASENARKAIAQAGGIFESLSSTHPA